MKKREKSSSLHTAAVYCAASGLALILAAGFFATACAHAGMDQQPVESEAEEGWTDSDPAATEETGAVEAAPADEKSVDAPASGEYDGRDTSVVYKRNTTIDFSDVTVDGELTKPDGSYLESRKLQNLTLGSDEDPGDSAGEDIPYEEEESLDYESNSAGGEPSAPMAEAAEAPGFFDAIVDGVKNIPSLFESDKKKGKDDAQREITKAPLTQQPPPARRPRPRPQATLAQRQALASMGSQGEELWVIARAHAAATPAEDPWAPGSGELRTQLEGQQSFVPLPLKHTDVKAQIAGYVASVRVTQQYHNPFAEKIEAVYVFPLPQDAAVSEFVMVIGDRKIRGIIRERQEAERIYREARRAGHVASLLTQERPNIFTQKVANIEPGKAIDIDLTYYNTLPYRDGAYVFAFPMVVGPRFNPPGTSDGVGAVARSAAGSSGQPTEVSYLRPEERSGHELSLTVDLDAGVTIEEMASSTHEIEAETISPNQRRVVLAKRDVIPNKDFVLRYRVAGRKIKSALLTHEDERGGYFTLMLQPPASLKRIPRSPREMIFVLDCSGSMSGAPLDKAKRAVRRVLTLMEPEDTFQIIRFSNNASQLGPRPLLATRKNIRRGLRYLESLHGTGGTMMVEGVKAALDFPHEDGKLRVVSFMTDGYIGNETEILAAIHDKLGPSRLFSFGVGSSVNRYLLERMAKMGHGAVAYVELNQAAADEAVDAFYERIAYPALSYIEIDWGSLDVAGVYPSRLPDLHVGRPVVITGRFSGELAGSVRVIGRAGGERLAFSVSVEPASRQWPALAQIWARQKIADFADRATYENDVQPLVAGIKETALSYGMMSKWTAFVAVDSSRVTEMEYGVTVPQPVPVPEGVRYDSSVSDPAKGSAGGGELAKNPSP